MDQSIRISHFWLSSLQHHTTGSKRCHLNSAGGLEFGLGTKTLFLTLAVLQDVGSEPALVPDVGGILAVLLLDHALQSVVKLRPYPQSLPAGQTNRRRRKTR